MKNRMLAIIDAPAQGNFDKLTLHRLPGALPYAGRYRLIDFALSNIKNAFITNVAVFPSGNYRSLQDHVGSGKRWNLDRRRDGLFILPPKNLSMPAEDSLSFMRMHEHIEYFRRSTQEYALVMPADIVWNIDFLEVLDAHIASHAHITEIKHGNTRLQAFIISKKDLIEYINNYDVIPYKTLNDIVLKKKPLKYNVYDHQPYTKRIDNASTYLRSNLDLLKFEIGNSIFSRKRPILTKEKSAPPARYMQSASVNNAMIGSGSLILGRVSNSVVGRDCVIKEGAEVHDSVLMSNAIIETGAYVHHAIIDKGVVVKKNTVLEGDPVQPFVTQKEQVITTQSNLNVLFAAAEAYPYVKTGGLADVVGGLSRALSKKGVNVSVALPLYPVIKMQYQNTYTFMDSLTFDFDGEARKVNIYWLERKKVRYYFIENFKYFDREPIYGHGDDCLRFAFYALGVSKLVERLGGIDIVHAHDWHAGMVPRIMNHHLPTPPKTVLTIHNIDYQGECEARVLQALNLPAPNAAVNFLEDGIQRATKLTTVSPTYRNELRYEYFGKNLTGAILRRERDFYGVLNGLSKVFSPNNDKVILSRYDASNAFAKTENKLALQKRMNLPMGIGYFVIAMVSRITEQKGFELVIPAMHALMERHDNVQFVLLGSGDEGFIEQLRNLEQKYQGRVRLNIGYDAAHPNHIYAGADLFLMPSRVEPCGLSQMIAMKYGTIPLVRRTGGLADSVKDYDPISKEGTGFSFYNYDFESLDEKLETAYDVFTDNKNDWRSLILRAMHEDFSLASQAQKILEIYLTIKA